PPCTPRTPTPPPLLSPNTKTLKQKAQARGIVKSVDARRPRRRWRRRSPWGQDEGYQERGLVEEVAAAARDAALAQELEPVLADVRAWLRGEESLSASSDASARELEEGLCQLRRAAGMVLE
ncbi:unnamed protein product, partial [Polarella glacialis]